MGQKKKELNYHSLLKKTLTKFFMNLIKIPELLPIVNNINSEFRNYPIENTALMLVEELQSCEKDLFLDEYNSVFKLSVFKGKLPLRLLEKQEATIKYLRFIYVYALGCHHEEKAKHILLEHKKFFKKKDFMNQDHIDPKLQKISQNLPPNLGSIVSSISNDLSSDLKNFKPQNIDLSNPIGSLLGSGLNIPNLMNNVIPKIQNEIEEIDPDVLGKEIAQLLKSMKKT